MAHFLKPQPPWALPTNYTVMSVTYSLEWIQVTATFSPLPGLVSVNCERKGDHVFLSALLKSPQRARNLRRSSQSLQSPTLSSVSPNPISSKTLPTSLACGDHTLQDISPVKLDSDAVNIYLLSFLCFKLFFIFLNCGKGHINLKIDHLNYFKCTVQ